MVASLVTDATDEPGKINSLTEKVVPVSADTLLINDSADSQNPKKVQVGNLPGGGGGFADPMTTRGDIIYRNPSNSTTRLGRGTVGQVIKSDGVDVSYETLDKTDVSLDNVDNLQQIPLTQKGSSNGVAELDGAGTVPVAQLPNSVQNGIRVVGFWNATTNTPDLSLLSLTDGEAYQVSVSGSTSLNSETNWKARDLVVWEDSLSGNWFKIDNTDDVLSVNSQTGAVTLTTLNISENTNLYYTESRVNANTNVSDNTTHKTSDGKDHSDVVLNNTHRTSDGSDHSIVSANQTKLGNYDPAKLTISGSEPGSPVTNDLWIDTA